MGVEAVGAPDVSAETFTDEAVAPEPSGADAPVPAGTAPPPQPASKTPPPSGTDAPAHLETDATAPAGTDTPARLPTHVRAHPGTDAPSLVALLEMALDPDRWEAFSRGSAIRRAGRAGFARNVCVALGNWLASLPAGEVPPTAVDLLSRALDDPEPLVRGHAAWALGRAGGAEARERLATAAPFEPDAWVTAEVAAARAIVRTHP